MYIKDFTVTFRSSDTNPMATNEISTSKVQISNSPRNREEANLVRTAASKTSSVQCDATHPVSVIAGCSNPKEAEEFVKKCDKNDVKEESIQLTPAEIREVNDSERDTENKVLEIRSTKGGQVIDIGNWNCKPGKNAMVRAKNLKIYIREILESLNCSLVALQESPWVVHKFSRQVTCSAPPDTEEFFPDRYNVIGNKEAAIYFDPNFVWVLNITDCLQISNDKWALRGRFTMGLVTRSSSNVSSSNVVTVQSTKNKRTVSYKTIFI